MAKICQAEIQKIVSMHKKGQTQMGISKATGLSVATVNKYIKKHREEARAEADPSCDLQKMDTLSKDGTTYRVTDVTGAVITAKSIVGDVCIKPKEVTIPVAAYVAGKSGYRKLDIPPVKISKIEPRPVTSKSQEKNVEKPSAETPKAEESRENHEQPPKKETVGKALERMRVNHEKVEQKRVETSSVPVRADILQKATQAVCYDREETYGSPEDNFRTIAVHWGAYLGRDLSPKDVANMMILFKVARTSTGKAHLDNWVDICGYAALAGELEEVER